jgi:lysophospholipase L1-like esterase
MNRQTNRRKKIGEKSMFWTKIKKYLTVVLFNIFLMIILLALFEAVNLCLVRNPPLLKKCSRKIQNGIGYLNAQERNIIQFEPDCAQYDKFLGYTLKPGECTFSGREFSNQYFINSLGVRDNNLALNHPKVIVAGDSFAMGWGVSQKETFAKILERKSGLRVLNAAISSYGTAREMEILRRVKTDRLKYLIIQYCGNDYEENKEFYLRHNVLHTMSEEEYRDYVKIYSQSKEYFPGKYLMLKVKKRINEFQQKNKTKTSPVDKDEVDLFLNTIIHNPINLEHVRIIAFTMNGRLPSDNIPFTEALKKKISSHSYPAYIKNMTVLDLSTVLTGDHFYVLDDHLNLAGHEVIAAALLKVIKKIE